MNEQGMFQAITGSLHVPSTCTMISVLCYDLPVTGLWDAPQAYYTLSSLSTHLHFILKACLDGQFFSAMIGNSRQHKATSRTAGDPQTHHHALLAIHSSM